VPHSKQLLLLPQSMLAATIFLNNYLEQLQFVQLLLHAELLEFAHHALLPHLLLEEPFVD